jgi:hypothetical protein
LTVSFARLIVRTLKVLKFSQWGMDTKIYEKFCTVPFRLETKARDDAFSLMAAAIFFKKTVTCVIFVAIWTFKCWLVCAPARLLHHCDLHPRKFINKVHEKVKMFIAQKEERAKAAQNAAASDTENVLPVAISNNATKAGFKNVLKIPYVQGLSEKIDKLT